MSYTTIKTLLLQAIVPTANPAQFFKTTPGSYSQHDQFIGIPVPTLRKIAQQHNNLSFDDLQQFLDSPINEERLFALIILTNQYKKSSEQQKIEIYNFYLKNLKTINNWNLVDSSAHLIIGAHTIHTDKQILLNLAQSSIMWERRIAIVSTWYFIRHHHFDTTQKIAILLLKDKHDLIHKAVGWMLREMGKKNQNLLEQFLDTHAHNMPRTMLRYAIEKFSEAERKKYMNKTINN